ncbi:uncharacterized protein LOC134671841 [Cydia fagiglandana]|uniref:uncharacterized protein LOC134671841 n=1 Tax=Cydia fagiglandana TaxID=1458189 RepID=UPI002FEE5BDD
MRRRKEDSDPIAKLGEQIRKLEERICSRSRSSAASSHRHGRYDRPRYTYRSRSRSRSWTYSRSTSRSLSPPPRSRSRSASKSRSRSPIIVIETADDLSCEPEKAAPEKEDLVQNSDKKEDTQAIEDISDNILALLGDAPEEVAFGPNLLGQVASRWQDIIKKGMNKDDRDKIMKKYPAPDNCKIIGAPKMNLEAQVAAGETLVHRDKAIEMKQNEVSCALTAIGLALNKLCLVPGNEEVIMFLSDSARLLCDYQHRESQLRKMFIISGLENKTARDTLRDCEVDQWLFGENLAEKLKASKAIEQSSKDLKNTKRPKKIQPSNLNFKGPTNNTHKPRARGHQKQYHRKPNNTSSAKPHHQQKRRTHRHYNSRR